MILDTQGEGWESILKPYQIVAMQYLWRVENGSSRDVYEAVNVELGKAEMGKASISRASIINSLNALVDEGVLSFHEITGKGGHRRIYKAVYDEAGTKRFLIKKFVDKLREIFPEGTMNTLPMPPR